MHIARAHGRMVSFLLRVVFMVAVGVIAGGVDVSVDVSVDVTDGR